MTQVVLPDWVARNRAVEEQERVVDRHVRIAHEFDRELKKLDPRLDLVMAKERPTDPRLVPGCFHIRRDNDGIDYSYIPLTTEEGTYREPVAEDIFRLRQRDMWRDNAVQDIILAHRAPSVEKERRTAAKRTELNREVVESAKRLASPGVSFGDQKWKARAKGRG